VRQPLARLRQWVLRILDPVEAMTNSSSRLLVCGNSTRKTMHRKKSKSHQQEGNSEMTELKASPTVRRAMIALGVGVVLATGFNPAAAHADEACPRVCITDLHRDGSNLHVGWVGNEPFARYQVYWERKGTLEIQTQDVAADRFAFDIPDVQPGSTYRIQVMGCSATAPWYADGPCGAVDQRDFTT
jgi:hypothetical protein